MKTPQEACAKALSLVTIACASTEISGDEERRDYTLSEVAAHCRVNGIAFADSIRMTVYGHPVAVLMDGETWAEAGHEHSSAREWWPESAIAI